MSVSRDSNIMLQTHPIHLFHNYADPLVTSSSPSIFQRISIVSGYLCNLVSTHTHTHTHTHTPTLTALPHTHSLPPPHTHTHTHYPPTHTGVPKIPRLGSPIPHPSLDRLYCSIAPLVCESLLLARLVHSHLRPGHLPPQPLHSFPHSKV